MALGKNTRYAISILSISMLGAAAAHGQELFKILPDDGAADDRFGEVKIDFDGATIIIGADLDDYDLGQGVLHDAGSAYIYSILRLDSSCSSFCLAQATSPLAIGSGMRLRSTAPTQSSARTLMTTRPDQSTSSM